MHYGRATSLLYRFRGGVATLHFCIRLTIHQLETRPVPGLRKIPDLLPCGIIWLVTLLNGVTVAGIYDLRLLQIKRCGRLDQGPCLRLTVARLLAEMS